MSTSQQPISSVADASSQDESSGSMETRVKRQPVKKAPSRRVTAVACLACQRRKTKCDGARPICAACHQRGAVCGYETADGLSRLADLKHKYQLLLSKTTKLERVLAKLRSGSDVEAANTLARLRLGDDLSQILGGPEDRIASRSSSNADSAQSFPRYGLNNAVAIDKEMWYPSSPTSQASMQQSPATSVSNLPEQLYRRLSQPQAIGNAQIPPMPLPGTKRHAESVSPVNSWYYDEYDNRRPSTCSAEMTPSMTSLGSAPGTETVNPAVNLDGNLDQQPLTDGVHDDRQPKNRNRREQIFETRRENKLSDAVDILDLRQHVVMSTLTTHQTAIPPSDRISAESIPVWAILPKHARDRHPVNVAIMNFMANRRSMVQQGVPPDTFMGSSPRLEGLFDEKAFAAADDLSRWAIGFALGFSKAGMLQIVTTHLAWYLMRWMIMPTPETYYSIPRWLRPIPDQVLIPHTILTDFLIPPELREAVLHCAAMQEKSDWAAELSSIVDCQWPYQIDAGLRRDGETGRLSLNPLLRDHIGNMSNWSVGSKLRAFMPDADTYLRIQNPEG